MQRKVNRLIRLATSFVILGLVPLLAAGTVLTGHFRSNMERVVLDDIGRMGELWGQQYRGGVGGMQQPDKAYL